MNILIIASILVTITLALGAILGTLFVRLSNMVVAEQETIEKEKSSYNPALTKGHKIPVEADPEEQLKKARLLAAKKAAVTPRGANMRIGQLGPKNQPTAFDGTEEDPISTVKIAQFHGWQVLRTGATAGPQAATTQAAGPAVAPTKRPEDLVPGKDYDYIEITDSMEPAEVRRARIANAKAKAAAVKALKAAGAAAAPAAGAPAAAPAAQQQAAQPRAAAPAASGAAAEPVAGVDYQVIEITDDMSPDEVRKARISNSKAKAAAFKAFKEAGGGQVAAPQAEPAAAPAAAPAQETAPAQPSSAALASIPKPDYVEITDDMDPAAIRKARIDNAKAKSAYQKALKAAGIDPATVEE